ncbi:cache domain-containing protein [Denitromonas ohlonensis]|uniref:Chemotaxis protein n=2 Tax=Denitromonas TaxID=139331 RepID=A0A558E7P3_9RHOO|nr:cache domain-containing protein [Denitromonas ohlonensis]TVO65908.1 chemotaxis protein [Denitromonas ohlonensis]TVO79501.1 chemotaxis protein [Denitromonas ohlonensis]TVT49810.1 MAG: chemotaxis protein [Denitromonas halophila]TVT69384.1 MAG: chemotaxis protein [Denitromonas halophila]
MTRRHSLNCTAAAILGLGLMTGAFAADRGTPREARALFDQAVKYMQANGPERSFAAFNNQKGKFVSKDLYVFVIDNKGTYHASGAAPETLVGLNVLGTTDAAGNPLFRDMIDTTARNGEGQVRYMWLNRQTNHVEPKVSYVSKVNDYVLGVGYFAPRSTAADAQKMLTRAIAYAKTEGLDKANAAFNDRHGVFVQNDLYVFAVDLGSGNFSAMGMNPTLTGKDAVGLTDAEGHAIVKEMIDKTASGEEAVVDYVWRNPVTNAVEKKRSYVRREGGALIGVGYYQE